MPKATVPALPLSALFGIVKPSGPTSMSVINDVKLLVSRSKLFVDADKLEKSSKKKINLRKPGDIKIGQGGTLDPLADGVLVVGVGKATKKLGQFLECTKEYRTTCLLGCETDTYDSEGSRVRLAPWRHVTRDRVESALAKFRGDIQQTPPIFSALKMDGRPLYEYARKGIPLPRPIEARKATVHSLELVEWKDSAHDFRWPAQTFSEEEKQAMEKALQGAGETAGVLEEKAEIPEDDEAPTAFVLKMRVSSGTYVRSIVHDLAHELGSAGHVVTLCRTRQGRFALEATEEGDRECVPWEVLEKASADTEVDEDGFHAWERESSIYSAVNSLAEFRAVLSLGRTDRPSAHFSGVGPSGSSDRARSKPYKWDALSSPRPQSTAMAANGVHPSTVSRPLQAGVFAPIPTFFLPESEDLDLPSFEAHVVRIASAGVGPLIAGSMGEAIHLSHSERLVLIRAARKALDAAGLTTVPLIVGTGAPSTRETIELTHEAAKAGADYAIVITSGYFAGVLAGNHVALKAFFTEVAEKSPIPIMIYNYPGASGGIDLDSDLISDLAMECPNICGVKLTHVPLSHQAFFLTTLSGTAFTSTYPRKNPKAPFLVLGGFIDFLTPSAFANGHGAITGLGNVSPASSFHSPSVSMMLILSPTQYAIRKLFELSEAARTNLSLLPEAQRLQGIIARADYTIAKASIVGTKFLLEKLYGYGGTTRKPLPPITPAAAQALWEHPHTQALVALERQLSGKTK
ncbi:Dihydrodipicolinate synthetase [Mycena venus]|uniref:tRNA pseudouridine(55) synthase n=1 Tax=Mycena venus TaxID=2733690 RepID=A0A8H7CJ70_9AGAR|nr:Dihydrodipicolinate synthetase [Mycena venus]